MKEEANNPPCAKEQLIISRGHTKKTRKVAWKTYLHHNILKIFSQNSATPEYAIKL